MFPYILPRENKDRSSQVKDGKKTADEHFVDETPGIKIPSKIFVLLYMKTFPKYTDRNLCFCTQIRH